MYGLAGQLSAAERTAPDGASDDQIIEVATRAHRERRDVRELWDEVMDHG